MKRILSLYILFMCCMACFAQTDRQHIRQGNRLYRQQKFDKAEVDYRKAVDKNQKNPQALYNLGCALMQQQKDSAAILQFEAAGKIETSKLRKAKSYHNIGVICQGHQMFSEAVDAYKESLRNNPNDNETRYNLALCQKQLKQQKQNQKQNQQDKDKNQSKEKEQQQDKDKNQDKKDLKQQQQEQMSRENAEQLLQAAIQEEKNTQQKMKQQQVQPQQRRLQKNW